MTTYYIEQLRFKFMSSFTKSLIFSGLCLVSVASSATVVKFETSMGDFEVNLFDTQTPATVANFLKYVEDGRYNDVIINRSVPGFVVQGGNQYLDEDDKRQPVETYASVVNEPKLSNVRGTIAMAKTPSNPNSATSTWFFNLDNNAGETANGIGLDTQNGGFTVFGQVMGEGMEIIDAIAALPTLDSRPLNNYSQADYDNGVAITRANYVVIESVTVIDANELTNADLVPVENTLIAEYNSNSGGESSNSESGGGGSFGWLSALLLGCLVRLRR